MTTSKINAVTLEDVNRVAKKYLTPEKMAIVIVGDKKVIEPKLKEIEDFGQSIVYLDTEGNPDQINEKFEKRKMENERFKSLHFPFSVFKFYTFLSLPLLELPRSQGNQNRNDRKPLLLRFFRAVFGLRNPIWIKYGSIISSIDSRSSLIEAEIVPTPTGPPSNFSMIESRSFLSTSSKPKRSTSILSSPRFVISPVIRPSPKISA